MEQFSFDAALFDHLEVKPQPKRTQRKKSDNVEYVYSTDMLRTLFPEDFSNEEHINALMDNDLVIWCEEDVRYFQRLLIKDVVFIVSRLNSSIDAINECMMWAFTENEHYDFSVTSCAAASDVSVNGFQRKLVIALAQTLRALKNRNMKKDAERIVFLRQCLKKSRNLLDEKNLFVELTSAEWSAQ